MHKLLQRQLKKTGANVDKKFLELVDQAYKDADEDRKLLERSLELSSKEMRELYNDLEHQVKSQLQASQERFSRLMYALRKQYIFFSLDKNLSIDYISESVFSILGYSPQEIINKSVISILENDPFNIHLLQELQTIKNQIEYEPILIRLPRKNHNNHKIYFEASIYPVFDENGELHAVEGLIKDITKEYELKNKLEYLSTHDQLTHLHNRHSLQEKMNYIIAYSKRNHKKFAILYIDIDNFKNVNDTLGHKEGDNLLKNFAKTLQKIVRNSDVVARIGGDEFIIVYTDIDQSNLNKFIEKTLLSIDNNIDKRYKQLGVSVSIGISLFPNDGESLSILLKKADQAMYKVKKEKKNGFAFFKK